MSYKDKNCRCCVTKRGERGLRGPQGEQGVPGPRGFALVIDGLIAYVPFT